MRNQIIIQSLLLMLFPVICSAAIYKWTAPDGSVHYSQQKPPSTDVKRMHVDMQPPSDTSTYKKPGQTDKEQQKKTAKEQPESGPAAGNKPAEPQLSKKQKKQLCDQARKTLDTLTTHARIREKDKEGNISYMDDKRKNERIKLEKENINKYCH